MFSFTGRNILVTGAGSGIGKATALAVGQQGGSLIVVDRNQETADRTVEQLEQIGSKAKAIWADISDLEAVDRMYAETLENFETLDGIVHCAGIGIERTIMETTIEEWKALTAKILVVSDKSTRLPIREIVDIFAQACPHWSFRFTTDGGHMAPLTRPDLINPIVLEFLDGGSA